MPIKTVERQKQSKNTETAWATSTTWTTPTLTRNEEVGAVATRNNKHMSKHVMDGSIDRSEEQLVNSFSKVILSHFPILSFAVSIVS